MIDTILFEFSPGSGPGCKVPGLKRCGNDVAGFYRLSLESFSCEGLGGYIYRINTVGKKMSREYSPLSYVVRI